MLILIVDDEALVRTLLKRILSDEGYGVVEASSGEDAVRVLQTAGDTIDLVLTDLKMPGMHGTELGKYVAANLPTVPVLYMSGFSDEYSMLVATGEEFIEKPFKRHILLKKIQTSCTRRRTLLSSSEEPGNIRSAGESTSDLGEHPGGGTAHHAPRSQAFMGRGQQVDDTINRLLRIEWELARKRST